MSEKDIPTRVEIPDHAGRRTEAENVKPKLRVHRENSQYQSTQNIVMEDKLRATINPLPPHTPDSAPKGVVTAAEERVRMFEEMSRKKARQKMARNLIDSVILLMVLGAVVGLCLWWMSHKNKIAAEEARIAAESEANQIRMAEERDRLNRERREKDRLEREAALAREKEQQLMAQQERERVKREIRDNKERYQMFSMALRENNFKLFGKSVTNDIATTEGELCYLLPTEKTPMPLYWVVYRTNDAIKVYRLLESGEKEELGRDVFEGRIKSQDYLVAKSDTVYFKSTRKTPGTGFLGKTKDADPAEAFFGGLATTIKNLKPSYDELTFDVFFTPKNAAKHIFVENVEFGCKYSIQNVREAVEKNTPLKPQGVGSSSSTKKFKRTVKFWEGTGIKQGLDGITYVSRTPPAERVRHSWSDSSLPGYNIIYRSRSRSTYKVENSRERWQSLYDRAVKEDAEEAAYYERQREIRAERRNSAQSEAEAKWQKKIDDILKSGTLWYRIRKAKVEK